MKTLLFLFTIYAFIPLVFCQDATRDQDGKIIGNFGDASETGDVEAGVTLNLESMEDLEKLIVKEGLQVLAQMTHGEIEHQILQLVFLIQKAEKEKTEGLTSDEEVRQLYNDISDLFDGLIQSLKFRGNTYKFFKSKGMEQLVYSNFLKGPDRLKSKVLDLVIALHEMAPSTLNNLLRDSFAIDLVNMLEERSIEKPTKDRIVDVLSFWLPKNPVVQATILESKGLEAFYSSIKHLGPDAVYNLLKLFLAIFKEHLDATSVAQKVENPEKYKQYKDMEFVEILATPKMCLGFMDVFQMIFAYQLSENKVLVPVLDIVILLKPYCADQYKYSSKVARFIDELHKYITRPINGAYFKRMGINMPELKRILSQYTASYVAQKGEF